MMAFPGMLMQAAQEANMTAPDDPDQFEDIDAFKETHPHFWVFCMLQLCRPLTSWGEHWDNAKVIAEIPLDRLMKMTPGDFMAAGVVGIA